jgi:hypothetical protein
MEMQNMFYSFVQARSDSRFSFIKMYERSQEFDSASCRPTQNGKFHLQSCAKLAFDFHATNRIKHMRMHDAITSHHNALQLSGPQTWKALSVTEGEFSVVKSNCCNRR